jgi:uncharacterized protein YbjT (DUF2867 family)
VKVLVTGATGYIGGRLVPRLLERGHDVRVLVRNPEHVQGRPWVARVEVVRGNLLEPESLVGAFEGIEAAYYLVHSMYAGRSFALHDRRAALNFCKAARGLPHVVYLGGLVPRHTRLGRPRGSEHLRSRAEIGRILAGEFPLTELRAGPIIGSGSASFEMLRYTTERFPIMLVPSWVENEVAPIAVRDVLQYLVLSLERGPCGVVELGSERITYKQMMLDYASARNLRRWIFTIPSSLPSWFGAGWIGLLTPIPDSLARPLLEGMVHPLRARRFRVERLFPDVIPIHYKQAVELALLRIGTDAVATRWSDAGGGTSEYSHYDTEGMMRDVRSLLVAEGPEAVFRVFGGLGGARGWLTWGWAWKIRGLIDRALGGPGLRRGRRHRNELLLGEAVDFWRVEALEGPGLLRLRCEARLPGHAWLQWTAKREQGGTRLTQTAAFAPHGLHGVLYWYLLYPLHQLIFRDLAKAIARRAEQPVEDPRGPHPDVLPSDSPTAPPLPVRGVLGDIAAFLLRTPRVPTRIDFSSDAEREDYSKRVLQRLGRDVSGYSVLNLHRIGIEAPTRYVFEELLEWDRDSTCWPNELATIESEGGGLGDLRVQAFGKSWLRYLRPRRAPLFRLRLIERKEVPSPADPDNARFLLYRCEGGYPIGIFTFYVRSSIPGRGELGSTQVFVGAGFDFYGKERWPLFHPVNRVWETIHDRATRNMLNRFKQLCEWNFARTQAGLLRGDRLPPADGHDEQGAHD